MIKTTFLALLMTLLLPLFATSQDQSGGAGDPGGASGGQAAPQVSTEFAYQELGQQVYANNCAACHQAEGQGIEGVYPTLVGSELVTGAPDGLIHILLNGRGGMPSFASDLSNEQIAAVASRVRTAWGNEAEPITPEVVASAAGEEGEQAPGSSTARPGAAD